MDDREVVEELLAAGSAGYALWRRRNVSVAQAQTGSGVANARGFFANCSGFVLIVIGVSVT